VNRVKQFLKDELSGWKKWQIFWMIFANAMILGIVLIYACVGIIGLILGDLLMVLLDPRISLAKKRGGAA
jgi:ABC-type microcin C transport system permease subunit YejB